MSASQEHGFEIERLLKEEFQRRNKGWFPQNVPIQAGHTARFDVPDYVDPYGRGIPTSIKTARIANAKAKINLSDANRIADLVNFNQTRLLVALYQQAPAKKVFCEIREYIITGDEWNELIGGTPLDLINGFSASLKETNLNKAKKQALFWKSRLKELFPNTPITWNPKIDSKGQRRLQCSVSLEALEDVIQDKSRIKVFGVTQDPVGYIRPSYLRSTSHHLWGDGLRLPIVLISPPRIRKEKKKKNKKTKDDIKVISSVKKSSLVKP